jgi:hypothetical protein
MPRKIIRDRSAKAQIVIELVAEPIILHDAPQWAQTVRRSGSPSARTARAGGVDRRADPCGAIAASCDTMRMTADRSAAAY